MLLRMRSFNVPSLYLNCPFSPIDVLQHVVQLREPAWLDMAVRVLDMMHVDRLGEE